jgi:hypothetical protein
MQLTYSVETSDVCEPVEKKAVAVVYLLPRESVKVCGKIFPYQYVSPVFRADAVAKVTTYSVKMPR